MVLFCTRIAPWLVLLLLHAFISTTYGSGTRIPNFRGCTEPKALALPYCNISLAMEERLGDLKARLSLKEKIAMLSPQKGNACSVNSGGSPAIGLPTYTWLTETNTAVSSACTGPDKCATTFNGPLGIGASFNRTSWYLKGSVLGTEMRAFANAGWHRDLWPKPTEKIGITAYGPNINIVRDPRFGRNSELPGEDPFLSGTYGKEMVRGMQEPDSNGYPKTLAYLKHFTAYSMETNRMNSNFNITKRDLWETYLAQYEIAFKEGRPTGAMCSYASINGTPSCANNYLLNRVVRDMWGFPDVHITTDCQAVINTLGPPLNLPSQLMAAAETINKGTDIEMGSTIWTNHLYEAVKKGLVSEATVDAAWRRSYLPHFKAGRFDPIGHVQWDDIGTEAINSTIHRQIQYEAALQGLVLLKHTGPNGLPLTAGSHIAVLGPLGHTRSGLFSDYIGDEQCYNAGPNNLMMSNESSAGCVATIKEAIAAVNVHGMTTGAPGVDINSNSTSGIQAALELGRNADFIVLVLGIDHSIEHEGLDRVDTALPGLQEPFAQEVISLGKPVFLVLCNGGALAIDNLVPPPAVRAIVEAFNLNTVGSKALAASLFGHENRWGKLPITMYPHSYITEQPMDNYDMAKAPGRTYKYYTGQPLFRFGHGLSLTEFTHECSQSRANDIWIQYSCLVLNVGLRDGDEVLMVFHSAGQDVRSRIPQRLPIESLIDFQRVSVAPGMAESIVFNIHMSQLRLVDPQGIKTLYPGSHKISITRRTGLDYINFLYVSPSQTEVVS